MSADPLGSTPSASNYPTELKARERHRMVSLPSDKVQSPSGAVRWRQSDLPWRHVVCRLTWPRRTCDVPVSRAPSSRQVEPPAWRRIAWSGSLLSLVYTPSPPGAAHLCQEELTSPPNCSPTHPHPPHPSLLSVAHCLTVGWDGVITHCGGQEEEEVSSITGGAV